VDNKLAKLVKKLIKKSTTPSDDEQRLIAAQGGHLDVVKFLVEQQAEVNAKLDTDGWTPLHSTAQNGYLDAP
jgi:ankyrin repeat protein